MGNELGKVFRDDEDEYEVTLSVRKKKGNIPAAGDLAATEAAAEAAEASDEEPPVVVKRTSGRKREAPAAPLLTTAVKNKAMKISVQDEPSTGDEMDNALKSPPSSDLRGRRSTCITIDATENRRVMNIRIIKSHLSPLHVVTIPAEYVTALNMKEDHNYEIENEGQDQNSKPLQIKKEKKSFILDKGFWSWYSQKKNLALHDEIRLDLVGESKVRIDVVKTEVPADPAVTNPAPDEAVDPAADKAAGTDETMVDAPAAPAEATPAP